MHTADSFHAIYDPKSLATFRDRAHSFYITEAEYSHPSSCALRGLHALYAHLSAHRSG